LNEALNTLDHLQACETQAAERYLLGELPAAEAEDFELHYFECGQCAMAVESGELFIANARAALGTPDQNSESPLAADKRDKSGNWFRRFLSECLRPASVLPALAAAVFGAVALYQSTILIPAMRGTADRARALPAFQLVGASRGQSERLVVPSGSPFIALSIDVPPESHFAQYVCDFSADGKSMFRVISPAPADGIPISLLLPVKGLKPGSYELNVFGAGSNGQKADKITSSTFDLQFNQ
jgi:hypothetical protein